MTYPDAQLTLISEPPVYRTEVDLIGHSFCACGCLVWRPNPKSN